MQSLRVPYKHDIFGNPIFARVTWSGVDLFPKPTALVYHGGGLIVGSLEMVNEAQITYLTTRGFIVVVPNYRLAPQVTANEAFRDCEEAYDWVVNSLSVTMRTAYNVEMQTNRIVTMGHSSGGTIALHLGSCRPVEAVTAFYPSLFYADRSTSSHMPTTAPPFGTFPDFTPDEQEWQAINPADREISEASLTFPGGPPPTSRNKWQMHVLKKGEWLSYISPDGDFAAIDPLTRLNRAWPPVMIVQGEADDVPGSSLALARRAEKAMKAAGVQEVRLEVVPGEGHMFDLPPAIGTSDLGYRWGAVRQGLDFLLKHCV